MALSQPVTSSGKRMMTKAEGCLFPVLAPLLAAAAASRVQTDRTSTSGDILPLYEDR